MSFLFRVCVLASLSSSVLGQLDSGYVVDYLGRPVPGAKITTETGKVTFTDGSGYWQAKRRQFRLPWSVQAPGLLKGDLIGSNRVTTLQSASIIHGRVVDQTGQPIPRAWVAAASSLLSMLRVTGVTDGEGKFELRAPLGPLTFTVLADGYRPQCVEVRPNPGRELRLSMNEGASGTLELSIDSEAPQEVLAQLFVLRPASRMAVPHLQFDATRKLVLKGLPLGDLFVTASGKREGFVSPVDLRISALGINRLKIRRLIPSLTRIHGEVRDRSNRLLPGVEIALNDWGHQERVIRTDDKGHFTFSSHAPKNFPIHMRTVDEGWQIDALASEGLDKNSTILPATREANLVVERWRRVTGKVVDDERQAVRSLPFMLLPVGRVASVKGFRASNPQGEFSFLVPVGRPGRGRILISAVLLEEVFTVKPCENEALTRTVSNRSGVRSRLLDGEGEPVVGAKVWLKDLADQRYLPAVLSGSDGGFGFMSLAPGQYEIRVALTRRDSPVAGEVIKRLTLEPGQVFRAELLCDR